MPNIYLNYIASQEWKAKSRVLRKMTNNRCILFPWLKSNDAHHLTYNNLKNEIPVRDIVPLSRIAHNLVHRPFLWKTRLRIWINLILRLLTTFWIIVWWIVNRIF